MNRILVVARSELAMALRTKAFLVGLLLVPVLLVVSTVAQLGLAQHVDVEPRRFAVLDRTGALYPAIERAAAERNAAIAAGASGQAEGPPYLPERVEQADADVQAELLRLSERARRGEIFAFVDIPPGVLGTTPGASAEAATIHYYSDHPTYLELHHWLERRINEAVRVERYRAAGLDPAAARALERPVGSEHLGLLERGADGRARAAQAVDELQSYLLPLALMMMLFFPVTIGTPTLLQAVIEEKMSRISEVLLGSVSAFELMMGKLLGGVGMALLLGAVYVGGTLAAVSAFGLGGLLTPGLLGYYLVFLLLATLLDGALYLAVGAACNEPRDAQTMMIPIVLLTILPVVAFSAIMKAPGGPLAVGLSLFPFSAPFVMMLRLAIHPPPPLWQVVAAVLVTAGAVVGCVWAAARIFRIGLLAQGTAPSWGKLLQWLRTK